MSMSLSASTTNTTGRMAARKSIRKITLCRWTSRRRCGSPRTPKPRTRRNQPARNTTKEEMDMGKFKVGDRVRYKNPVYGEATVVRVNPDGSVVVDTHCEFGICTEDPNELEPVAVAASNSNPEQHLTIQAGRYYLTRDGQIG